ncbi:hypothetical protein SPRG_07405 [Saprolegnia parasitica CBS 223.65]|uniref:CRAL-TRIO domain-containing protein n=1 Tax=Saprolegnia parasitica (strain CBS 223.65) TaxID=695850 RepID=A0A067CMQ0_SAPPC|nr:hypothetical protein SPRG_07405 [Saprolegnia parasitica CBS 223.65]KDO27806.1 hypothetical protein SPRG_07405 [Saprolegnia parasitica CBS 223.65]|eukprot:XP_012201581.1 hypothetical protein SPRG_07405 [Saprolegnia parasitica CBS 223.65]
MGSSHVKPHEGMQWLAMSFLVILFLDSLAEVSFLQKVVLVVWCFLGKVYLHDLHAVEVLSSPSHFAPSLRRVHTPSRRSKSIDIKPSNPQEAVTPVPSPKTVHRRASDLALEKPSLRTTSMASNASTVCDSAPPSPTSSTASTDDTMSPDGLSLSEVERVRAFRKMLQSTEEAEFLLKDDYLHSVISVPNRSIEYAAEKLNRVLNWRTEYRAGAISPDEVAPQLRSGSMYWFGYDLRRRPILWLRPKKKDWSTMDKDLEVRTHVFMLELGIRELMPPGVSTFTLVTDCANVGYREVDMRLTKAMIEVCQGNYPDRIDNICVGPLTLLVKTLTKIISPLLPTRLREKAHFMDAPSVDLLKVMPPSVIPTFFGGSAEHTLHPSGDGYDFDYMLAAQRQRLEALRIDPAA